MVVAGGQERAAKCGAYNEALLDPSRFHQKGSHQAGEGRAPVRNMDFLFSLFAPGPSIVPPIGYRVLESGAEKKVKN